MSALANLSVSVSRTKIYHVHRPGSRVLLRSGPCSRLSPSKIYHAASSLARPSQKDAFNCTHCSQRTFIYHWLPIHRISEWPLEFVSPRTRQEPILSLVARTGTHSSLLSRFPALNWTVCRAGLCMMSFYTRRRTGISWNTTPENQKQPRSYLT